jgi:hypothetical protein
MAATSRACIFHSFQLAQCKLARPLDRPIDWRIRSGALQPQPHPEVRPYPKFSWHLRRGHGA